MSQVETKGEAKLPEYLVVPADIESWGLEELADRFLETEYMYVEQSLRVLAEAERRLRAHNELDVNRVLKEDDIQKTFISIEAVYKFNKDMLDAIMKLRWKGIETFLLELGNTLFKFVPFIGLYQEYLVKTHDAIARCLKLAEENKAFRTFLALHEQATKTSLPTLLRAPLERYPQYLQYLQSIANAIPVEHPAHTSLESTVQKFQANMDGVINRIRGARERNAVTTAQMVFFQNKVDLVDPSRRLLTENDLELIETKGGKKFRFFLFNDIIVQGSEGGIMSSPTVRDLIPVAGLRVTDVLPGEGPEHAFRLSSVITSTSWLLKADDAKTKRNWARFLDEVIREAGALRTQIMDPEELKRKINRKTYNEKYIPRPAEAIPVPITMLKGKGPAPPPPPTAHPPSRPASHPPAAPPGPPPAAPKRPAPAPPTLARPAPSPPTLAPRPTGPGGAAAQPPPPPPPPSVGGTSQATSTVTILPKQPAQATAAPASTAAVASAAPASTASAPATAAGQLGPGGVSLGSGVIPEGLQMYPSPDEPNLVARVGGWDCLYDADSNDYYYENLTLGETTWDQPAPFAGWVPPAYDPQGAAKVAAAGASASSVVQSDDSDVAAASAPRPAATSVPPPPPSASSLPPPPPSASSLPPPPPSASSLPPPPPSGSTTSLPPPPPSGSALPPPPPPSSGSGGGLPPPPPSVTLRPASASVVADSSPTGHDALMASIRAGAALKKAETTPEPSPTSSNDPRDGLLAAIRAGAQLRKASPTNAEPPEPAPMSAHDQLLAAIRKGTTLRKAEKVNDAPAPATSMPTALQQSLKNYRRFVQMDDDDEDWE